MLASFQSFCGSAVAVALEGVIEETGLRYWEWQGDGVLFRLTQRLPDQTRAFFLARGFGREDADFIATQCVFQTLFKNTGDSSEDMAIDLHDWKIRTSQAESALLTRESWRKAVQLQHAPAAAMIALEWSLLPTRQIYQRNDYNWGMTSYGLQPGTVFDLEFSWRHAGKRFEGQLSGIQCPADIHPQPGGGE